MLCPGLGELTVRSWLSLPLLFLGSSAGLTAVFALAVEPNPALAGHVVLSSPLLFGSAGALAMFSGPHVRWRSDDQRGRLRFPYPLALFGLALGADSLRVPFGLALGFGGVATALLTVFAIRAVRRPASCPTA